MSSTLELDLWRRAETLFEAALDHPQPEREQFLDRACGGNETLRELVRSLLLRDQEDSSFLESPVVIPSLIDPLGLAAESSPEDRWIGRRLGAYRVLRPIGAGGMAYVFLGERADGEVEQQVAIKVIRGEAEHGFLLRSLRQERQILTKLDHPNIARSLDGGTTEEGMPYVVLEYLEGLPVTEYCDAARLGIKQRLELFRKTCDAVDYAHRHLIVHRDLKPSNILVTSSGEPKLLDFGIAKLLDASGESTRGHDQFFTPNYASPEQLAGEPASTASDIYSLGILLYQLLTGLRPRDVESRPTAGSGPALELVAPMPPSVAAGVTGLEPDLEESEAPTRRAEARAASAAQLQRQLVGDLDSIVLLCLRRSPEDRYRFVGELAEDLRRYLSGLPVKAQAPSLSYRCQKFVRRHRIGVALGCLAMLALLALGLGIVMQSRQVATERDLAEEARTEAEEVAKFLTEAIELSDPYYRSESGLNPGDQVTVNEVLDYSAEKIRGQFAAQPQLQARLMFTIGTVFGGLARFEEAEALHRDALVIRRRHASDRPLELVDSLNGLIFLYVNTGRLEQAPPLVAEALEISRRVESGTNAQLAESLTNAGMLGFFTGNLIAAEEYLREALALRKVILPPDHQDLILNRTYLARVLTRKGDLDQAESYLREALEICQRAEGENHARMSSVLGDLAWLLSERGDYTAAEPYFRRSLEILEKNFGDQHPTVIEARGALGLLLREKGDLLGAEQAIRSNLELRRQARAEDLDGQAISMGNLGLILMDQDRPEEAEVYFRQALEIASDSSRESFRDRHTLLRNLALSLHAQGNPQAAEPLLREAVTLLRDELGEQSSRFGNGLTSLASVLISLERFEEALALAQQAEACLVAAQPEGHWRIAMARGALGDALVGLQRFDEAEPVLVSSLSDLQESAAHKPQVRKKARLRLIRLYESWRRPADAKRYRQPNDP